MVSQCTHGITISSHLSLTTLFNSLWREEKNINIMVDNPYYYTLYIKIIIWKSLYTLMTHDIGWLLMHNIGYLISLSKIS